MVAPATQSPSTPTSSTFTTTKTSIHTAPDASSASVLHLPTVSTPQYVPASSVSASLDPLVVFSVLDHYQRRAPNHTRVIGALLGSRSEDGSDTIEIKNSFPLVHYEGDRPMVEGDYFNQMYSLHQRVNAKEVLVGWYATGFEPDESSVLFHEEFFSRQTQPHPAVHLLIDTTLSGSQMSIKTFVTSPVGVPGDFLGSMFIQIPCEMSYFDAEKAGLDLMASKTSQPTSSTSVNPIASSSAASLLTDIDSLEKSILKIQAMLTQLLTFVNTQIASSSPITSLGNKVIGRYLLDSVASVPSFEKEEFEKMFDKHMHDTLMVVYLANLTRTQLSIAERLQGLL